MLLPKIPTAGIEIRTGERGWASSILSTSIPIAFLCCSVSLRESASFGRTVSEAADSGTTTV